MDASHTVLVTLIRRFLLTEILQMNPKTVSMFAFSRPLLQDAHAGLPQLAREQF